MSDLSLRASSLNTSESPPQDAQVVGGHSLLPWELVEATENHGPYICDSGGADVCDLYAMSNYLAASIRNGGTSYPIPFRNADANAAFIVKAVNSHEANEAKIAAAVKALDRLMRIIDSGIFRDGTHLSIEAHPAVDAARTTLSSLKEGK